MVAIQSSRGARALMRLGRYRSLSVPPSNFDLGDSFQSTEVRVSKEFNVVTERLKLELSGEIFNLFNVSNKRSFRGDLDNSFGQATEKASPTFGLGGPRIFQIGGRIKF